MQTNQSGPNNAGVNITPTQCVRRIQGVSNVRGIGGVTSAPLKRTFIWSGTLEWTQNGKPSVNQRCQVSTIIKEVEPELKVDTWPSKLLMQLIPKKLIRNIGGQYLKNNKWVQFHLQQNEALDALTKAMVGGFAGCVRLCSMSVPLSQCNFKVLILLYDLDKKAYLGFIPNNQSTFVEHLRNTIEQEMSKQLPAPGGGAIPASHAGGGIRPSMSSMSGQQPQHHAQGMMMGSGMGVQVGQVSTPLDELDAALEQNLKKIQHLQETLEAAHQHFITLHSELILKEANFKHQLQQMQRAAAPRLLHLPANLGLRHLQQQEAHSKHQPRGPSPHLQRPHLPINPDIRNQLQQPRYGAGGTRAEAQTQQFDDVSIYDSIEE